MANESLQVGSIELDCAGQMSIHAYNWGLRNESYGSNQRSSRTDRCSIFIGYPVNMFQIIFHRYPHAIILNRPESAARHVLSRLTSTDAKVDVNRQINSLIEPPSSPR